MSDGPFSDAAVKHYLVSVQTQAGIREYAEAMAQVLAEAGRASSKVTGDAPTYAVRQWSKVILDRALDILQAEEPKTQEERMAKLQKKLKHGKD